MDTNGSIISRYESKYIITEEKAAAIREFIRAACSPDKHVDADGRYTVNNLYFDTPDLRFYYDTKFKRFNRFKPRVRFYGDSPNGLLWLELKHKVKNVTWKTRRSIPVEQWPRIFNGRPQESECLRTTLRESFEGAVHRFGASPILHVRYVREPYVSDLDAYGRITFDRCLTYRLAHGSYELVAEDGFRYYDDAVTASNWDGESHVLLEIKTETNVPFWVMRLIQIFELQQRGFSKYCYSLDNSFEYADGIHRTSVLA